MSVRCILVICDTSVNAIYSPIIDAYMHLYIRMCYYFFFLSTVTLHVMSCCGSGEVFSAHSLIHPDVER